jgi:hypothetical protein
MIAEIAKGATEFVEAPEIGTLDWWMIGFLDG